MLKSLPASSLFDREAALSPVASIAGCEDGNEGDNGGDGGNETYGELDEADKCAEAGDENADDDECDDLRDSVGEVLQAGKRCEVADVVIRSNDNAANATASAEGTLVFLSSR